MLIKYKGKLFKEVKAKNSFVDSAVNKKPHPILYKRALVDAELAGDEVREFVAEIKGRVPDYTRAIGKAIEDKLGELEKKNELDYRDIDQAVIKAVEVFISAPGASITDF